MTPKPLYAVHGANDLDYGDGWVVLTRGIGCDPDDHGGEDFAKFAQTPIVRLNNGYGSAGTVPWPEFYEDFAQRCANYVEASRGCSRWIIGNEPNHSQERPGGQPITAKEYAECYTLCREAIRAVPFHDGDQVLLAPIAPWNVETGDWVAYFETVQDELSVGGCDGFAIHTYAREQTPASITDDAKMEPPHQECFWGFRHYMNWMAAILPRFQGLPCYLTEFCIAGVAWLDENTGCVQGAYREIDAWNTMNPSMPILCLAMYRWGTDQWAFYDKPGVIEDYMMAVAQGYTFPPTDVPPEENDMLQNPSFEGGWHQQGAGELVLPDGWVLEYVDGDHPWCGPQGKRPEVKPNTEFSTDGMYSIRAFPPAHSRGMFGIFQEVEAVPGQWYRFSADVRVESNPPGEMAGFVGIQPWGAGLFERQMVWGKETQEQLKWKRVEVIAQAFGGKIRVAMGANNKWATKNNTVWWDNAKLELYECGDGGGTEPPEPEPGECGFDLEAIRAVVREELDATIWASRP